MTVSIPVFKLNCHDTIKTTADGLTCFAFNLCLLIFAMPQTPKESTKDQKLADRKADQFVFKSLLKGPIADLSFLERSVLFAEVSMIAYLSMEECNIAAGKLGFIDGKFFNTDCAQAYWFQSQWDSVIVFRGTEPREWDDISADIDAVTAVAETVGKVHRGFKREVDQVWPYLEEELADNEKPMWFCGHSLGGAMATICASRATLSHIRGETEELYTYGSPRVGCNRYINHVKVTHYRWVNNNDIVTRMPPTWLGYRHGGQELYLDQAGHLRKISGWRRTKDRLKGLWASLLRFRIDYLSDHSMLAYIDNIFQNSRSSKTSEL